MRVLIADDDRVHVCLVSGRLKAMGYDVVAAFDAMQAWMAVLRSAPDAILLDINMPAGTGMEVLRRLKTSTRTNLIPVVVVSGSIDPRAGGEVQNLGAVAFLPKPVDFDELDRTLRWLLGSPSLAAKPA